MTEDTSSKSLVIQRHIMFIHAWSTWDTTSATCGHGKMYLREVLNRVSEIQNLPSIVSDRDALADEIGSVELRLFCLLYGGTTTYTLTSLRYARDMAMVAKSNKIVPQWLPPTERLTHYHRLHVYPQLIRCTVLGNDMFQAREWG